MYCAVLVEGFKFCSHLSSLRGTCFGFFNDEESVRFSSPLFKFTTSVDLIKGCFEVGSYMCSCPLPADKYLSSTFDCYCTFKCEPLEEIF